MSVQAGAGLILRPAGASAGSARANAALKEPFRSEPQTVRMFRASAMLSPRKLGCGELGSQLFGYQCVVQVGRSRPTGGTEWISLALLYCCSIFAFSRTAFHLMISSAICALSSSG